MAIRKLFSNLPNIRRVADLVGASPVGEPQKQYAWELWITGGVAAHMGDIRFFAKTVSLPQKSIEPIYTELAGVKYQYPGKDTSARTITATFFDDEHLTVYNYMKKWIDLMHTPGEGDALPKAQTVANIAVKLKDSTDLVQTLTVNMPNAFIIDLGEVPLDYETSDAIEITVTFAFDDPTVEDGQKLGDITDLLKSVLN